MTRICALETCKRPIPRMRKAGSKFCSRACQIKNQGRTYYRAHVNPTPNKADLSAAEIEARLAKGDAALNRRKWRAA